LAVCFYFGTFNPIHTGHLILAQSAIHQFGFKQIIFVPAGIPPHRATDSDLISASQRAQFVELSIADNPQFHMDAIELEASSPSYTIETLEKIKQSGKYDLKQNKAIPMIIGSDALSHLATWHRPQDLIDSVCFIQACRPGTAYIETIRIPSTNAIKQEDYKLNTHLLEAPLMSISSTQVRQKLHLSQDFELNELRYILPEPVRQSLIQKNVYK
jgi:nicotinate-nucleotide adenylyltransferase